MNSLTIHSKVKFQTMESLNEVDQNTRQPHQSGKWTQIKWGHRYQIVDDHEGNYDRVHLSMPQKLWMTQTYARDTNGQKRGDHQLFMHRK